MKRLIISVLFILSNFALLLAQDPFCETIVVEGKSSLKMTPEIISFHINFTLQNQDYSKCQELALDKIEKIKSDFEKDNIDQELIKTLHFSVRELTRREPETGKQVFEAYQAHIPMLVRTKYSNKEVPKIFELIKQNFKSDVRINFDLSDSQIEEMKEKLIELAVEDAKIKAGLLVKNLGYKLGNVSKIQYGEPRKIRNFTRTNYDLLTSQQLETASSTVRVSPKALNPAKVELRTTVMLAWGIKYE